MFKRISIAYQTLIAFIAAIFAGLFFGPYCAILQPIGQAYIMLLMMVILPFIATGVIYGLGSLTPNLVKRLLTPIFWVIALTTLFVLMIVNLFGLLIPKVRNTVVVITDEAPAKTLLDLFDLLIPQNPFYDLVNNYVPAIAIFGLIMGSVCIFVKDKSTFLSVLNTTNILILRFIKGLGKFSPIAVFCLLGSTLGTIDFVELQHLLFYLAIYIIIVLSLVFFILPYLLTAFIDISYRNAIKNVSPVLMLVFATTMASLSIPFLVGYIEDLAKEFKKIKKSAPEGENLNIPEAIASLSYNFMQIGNLGLVLFIMFAAFFFRTPINGNKEFLTNLLVIPMGWGGGASGINGIQFFAQFLNIPIEAIDLFFSANSITRNFQALANVMGMYFFCTITAYSYYKHLKLRPLKILTKILVVCVLLIALVFGLKKTGIGQETTDVYQDEFKNVTIDKLVYKPLPAEFLQVSTSDAHDESGLERIIKSKVLRVGYNADTKPYCFWNGPNNLIGYDIAFAYQLAKDLNCEKIQFVPFTYQSLDSDLINGAFDIAMSSVVMSSERLTQVAFTSAYADLENVLVVLASRKKEFEDLEKLQDEAGLKIGAIYDYVPVAKRYFHKANVLEMNNANDLKNSNVDVLFWSMYHATSWIVNNPDYIIIAFPKKMGKVYLSYAVPPNAESLIRFVNDWLFLQKQSNFTQRQIDFWLLNKPLPTTSKRWSIIQDELHWVN
ncbi:MAG: cation:dicarboxylase symporter family transporter [Parachlamydiales bacterium]|nr:cation:dicarboxylase symporter family transporter [Parachlamydiales bacterium]